MKLLLPALILFLLAFAGLSIGIMFGRKGISGGCSSNEGKIADILCTCGRDEDSSVACETNIAVEVICPEQDPEGYQLMLDELEKRG